LVGESEMTVITNPEIVELTKVGSSDYLIITKELKKLLNLEGEKLLYLAVYEDENGRFACMWKSGMEIERERK